MFDVQMMGGIVLHEGDVAEMKTGEGKTFVASLALYLNALPTVEQPDGRILGQGVHLVTVNDYLAKRDAEWNRRVYERLGMTVGHIEPMMDPSRSTSSPTRPTSPTARTPSSASTTCATTWRSRSSGTVQRGHAFAIVDEVDSILIDEARTPLIISGEPTTAAKLYYDMARVVRGRCSGIQSKGTKTEDAELQDQYDYIFDEKHKTVVADRAGDREGRARAQGREPLRPARTCSSSTTCIQALKAESLFKQRRRLRRPGRRGEDRRRVHRPHHGGPPLVGGPPPGGRGEGGRSRSRRSTRRSPRSPSRTTSASTRSSAA